MSSYLNSYSDTLKCAMNYFNVTVNDLSEKTGLLPSAIEAYLSGDVKPSRGTTSIINDVLFGKVNPYSIQKIRVLITRVHPQGYAFGEDAESGTPVYIPNTTVTRYTLNESHEKKIREMAVVPSTKRKNTMVAIKIHDES